MDIRQLNSFRMIAMTGSFSVAAERLGLTQSALSHHIAQLEESLATKLLVRARPNVYVTDAGEVLLSSAERVLAELNEIRAQFGLDMEGDSTPIVRVAATALGFAYIYGDLCHAFIEAHPDIKLDFTATETAEAAISKVLTRAADLAFVPLSEDLLSLDIIDLAEVEHVFIVGPSHALAKRVQARIDDVLQYPFVRYHRGSGSRAMSDDVFRAGYPTILTESNDTDFVKRIVSIGLGVALVPIFSVAKEIRSGVLHALRLDDRKIVDNCGIATNKRRPMKTLEKFRAVCLECRGPKPRQFILETLDTISFYEPVPEALHSPPAPKRNRTRA